MSMEKLVADLTSRGITYKIETDFSGISSISGSHGRLVILNTDGNGRQVARQWLHSGRDGEWYLGLFAGPIFMVANEEMLIPAIEYVEALLCRVDDVVVKNLRELYGLTLLD